MNFNSILKLLLVIIYPTFLFGQIKEEVVFDEHTPNQTINIDGQEYNLISRKNNFVVVGISDSLGIVDRVEQKFIIPLSGYNKIDIQPYGFRVKSNRKYGLFDLKGNQVLPVDYNSLHEFYPKIAIYRDAKGHSGLYNSKLGLSPIFCGVINNPKSKNLLASIDCEKYKFYSAETMSFLSEDEYTNPRNSNNGYTVKRDGKFGSIDFNGRQLIDFSYDEIIEGFEDKSGQGVFIARESSKWGIMNFRGHELIPFEYDKIENIIGIDNKGNSNENLYLVEQNNKWGLIDIRGNKLIDIKNDNLIKNDMWGEQISFISEENGIFKLVDIQGENLLDNEYELIEQLDRTRNFKIKLNDKVGILSLNNEEVVPMIYDDIKLMWKKDRYEIRLNDLIGFIDLESGITVEPKYEYMERIEKVGYIVNNYQPEQLSGFISFDGEIILESEFKSILQVNEYNNGSKLKGLLISDHMDKYALFDWEGNQKTKFVFDDIEYYGRASILVTVGDSKFEIDQNGNCIKDCPEETYWMK